MAVKILIADDENMIRYLIREMINNLGLDVEIMGEASDGEECLSLFRRIKPQIVMTDIVMPKLRGLDLIRQLRELVPNVLIILFSAYKSFDYAQQAVRDCAFDYLVKPVQEDELKRVLQNAIAQIEDSQRTRARMDEMKAKLDKYQKYIVMGEGQNKKYFKDTIEKAVYYVQCNFHKDISLREVSDRSFFSLTYFSEQFKQRTGQSFNDYLNNLRIEKAKELLLIPELKITEVGELVGYHNSSYFIKVFKLKTGLTPNDFRRLLEQSESLV